MSELKSYGIVLRTRDYREADRLVAILTREEGRITAVARGVRKVKSRFKALATPLTLGFFLLHRSSSLYTLIQGEIVKPYEILKNDVILYSYAQYFCELCEAALQEGEAVPEVFELLLTALENLEKDQAPKRVARCFELNLLEALGYRPVLDCCLNCGDPAGPFAFDTLQGGLLCLKCRGEHGAMPVSGAAVAVMRRFLDSGFYRLSICSVPAPLSAEIRKINLSLLSRVTGRNNFKSLDVIDSLEE